MKLYLIFIIISLVFCEEYNPSPLNIPHAFIASVNVITQVKPNVRYFKYRLSRKMMGTHQIAIHTKSTTITIKKWLELIWFLDSKRT